MIDIVVWSEFSLSTTSQVFLRRFSGSMLWFVRISTMRFFMGSLTFISVFFGIATIRFSIYSMFL